MTLRGHEGIVLAVAFDRTKIMSASDDGTLRTWVWAVRGPKQARERNGASVLRNSKTKITHFDPRNRMDGCVASVRVVGAPRKNGDRALHYCPGLFLLFSLLQANGDDVFLTGVLGGT